MLVLLFYSFVVCLFLFLVVVVVVVAVCSLVVRRMFCGW